MRILTNSLSFKSDFRNFVSFKKNTYVLDIKIIFVTCLKTFYAMTLV